MKVFIGTPQMIEIFVHKVTEFKYFFNFSEGIGES